MEVRCTKLIKRTIFQGHGHDFDQIKIFCFYYRHDFRHIYGLKVAFFEIVQAMGAINIKIFHNKINNLHV